jgi:predicted outer membrane lipoprotein
MRTSCVFCNHFSVAAAVVTFCLLVVVGTTRTVSSDRKDDQQHCDRPLDVAFLLDCSGSNWKTILTFASHVVSQLSPSARGTHVAALRFGADPTILFGLTDQPDFGRGDGGSTGFGNQTTGNPPRKVTGRDVSAALRVARHSIFTNSNGDRPEVPDVIVLVVGGVSDNQTQMLYEAERAKSDGVWIVTVAFADRMIDELISEIRSVATDPTNDVVFIFGHSNPMFYESDATKLRWVMCNFTDKGLILNSDKEKDKANCVVWFVVLGVPLALAFLVITVLVIRIVRQQNIKRKRSRTERDIIMAHQNQVVHGRRQRHQPSPLPHPSDCL